MQLVAIGRAASYLLAVSSGPTFRLPRHVGNVIAWRWVWVASAEPLLVAREVS